MRSSSGPVAAEYDYTNDGLLHTASYGGTTTLTNTWDAMGNRVGMTVNSTDYEFVYDATAGIPAVVEELKDGTPDVIVRYFREPGGELISRTEGAATHYYHFDALGSTRLLTNGSQTVTDKYAYDAYGALISHDRTANSVDQPYQYVGQLGYYTHWMEPEFGLLQLGVRFYDPEVGRFTQRDAFSIWSSSDYDYCRGNPKVGVDPSGLSPKKESVTGEGSCYNSQFANCCTSCGQCFNQGAATAAALPEGQKAGWKCGDVIECCRTGNPKNCVTVTINDIGKQEGRLIDFGCGYVIGKGFFPGVTTAKVTCKKTGHTNMGKRKCQDHSDCAAACNRGVMCGGSLGKK